MATFLGHHVAELGLLFQNHHPTSLCKKLGVLIAHCTISIFLLLQQTRYVVLYFNRCPLKNQANKENLRLPKLYMMFKSFCIVLPKFIHETWSYKAQKVAKSVQGGPKK